MTVKRYDRGGYPSESGIMVPYIRYEELQRQLTAYEATVTNLEAQVRGLSAENAVLKGFITDDCWVYDKVDERYRGAVYCTPKTPATDAALAEMRAQGVEMLAESIAEMHEKTVPDSQLEKSLCFAAEACVAFADKLRKEQGK